MDKSKAISVLSQIMIQLDKLQVELSEDSLYDTPTPEETRKRILTTFDGLDQVFNFIQKHL